MNEKRQSQIHSEREKYKEVCDQIKRRLREGREKEMGI